MLEAAGDRHEEFLTFAAKHNRNYASAAEFKHREEIWSTNHAKVNLMNQRAGTKARFEDNFTSDLTEFEFESMLGL